MKRNPDKYTIGGLMLGNASQESLFSLAWEVEEYRRLLASANELKDRMNKISCVYGLPISEMGNIPQELSMLRQDLLEYVQHLFIKHRDPTSHLLILWCLMNCEI